MWLGFFKECMVSLIFLGINLLSLSITFFWSQLKLWSASQQRLAISFLSQSQFLTDLLCSSERDLSGIASVIRIKMLNTAGNQITTLTGIRRKLLKVILISHITQLLLIRKLYCFRKGSYISFKYARHNHLRCPMIGEVSLET